MRTKRFTLVVASLALVGGMTAACGSSPTDASKEDFCSAYEEVSKAGDEKAAEKALDKLDDVGTPEDISDEARDGFEILMDNKGKDADDFDEDTFDEDEQKAIAAFFQYASTC